MHPVPVGETGGSKGQGPRRPEGDHPACTEQNAGRLGTPADVAEGFTLARREGRAPSARQALTAQAVRAQAVVNSGLVATATRPIPRRERPGAGVAGQLDLLREGSSPPGRDPDLAGARDAYA